MAAVEPPSDFEIYFKDHSNAFVSILNFYGMSSIAREETNRLLLLRLAT